MGFSRRKRIGGSGTASAWAGTVTLLALGIGLIGIWLALRITGLAATPAGGDPVLTGALALAGLCCVVGAAAGAATLHREEADRHPTYTRRDPALLRRPARHLSPTR